MSSITRLSSQHHPNKIILSLVFDDFSSRIHTFSLSRIPPVRYQSRDFTYEWWTVSKHLFSFLSLAHTNVASSFSPTWAHLRKTLETTSALPLCRSAALPLCRSAALPLCRSAALPAARRSRARRLLSLLEKYLATDLAIGIFEFVWSCDEWTSWKSSRQINSCTYVTRGQKYKMNW